MTPETTLIASVTLILGLALGYWTGFRNGVRVTIELLSKGRT